MLEQYAAEFWDMATELSSVERLFWRQTDGGRAAPLFTLDVINHAFVGPILLDKLLGHCEALGMRVTAAAIRNLQHSLTMPRTQPETSRTFEGLRENAQRVLVVAKTELETVRFLLVPFPKDEQYLNPLAKWDEALAKFPEITTDVEEATKCFALSRYTAAVFHFMRVMELGVQQLGNHFSVARAADKLWGDITNEIGQKVKALPRSTPTETAIQASFAEAALHLDHVRLAWRNPTMHPKQTYTEDEAQDVLGKVRIFMNHLATII
jgi:hypothetical protein